MTCAIPIYEICGPVERLRSIERDTANEWADTSMRLAAAGDLLLAETAATKAHTTLTVGRIMRGVSVLTGVTCTQILSKSRRRAHVDARHATFWLLREKLGLSFPDIADVMNMACHTSVMHGVDRVSTQLAIKDAWFCDVIGNLR